MTNPNDGVMESPKINWIKYDAEKHQSWWDGTRVMIALQVTNNKTKVTRWEFDIVNISADGDSFSMSYDGGEPYDAWSIDSIEYFHILDGEVPMRFET
jgi:hypothetical protein